MMNSRQLIALAAAAIVLCTVFTYIAYGDDSEDHYPTWDLSNLIGNLPDSRPDAADDFYAYSEYDWLAEDHGILMSTPDEMSYNVSNAITSFDPSDPDSILLWSMMDAYVDTELRDETGPEDLMPYVEPLMDASSLADLTEYLTGGDCVIADPFFLPVVYSGPSLGPYNNVLLSHSMLTFSPGTYSDPGYEEMMDAAERHYAILMELMGYTPEQASAMNDAATAVEEAIASGTSTAANGPLLRLSVSEMESAAGPFPVIGILEGMGFHCDEYLFSDTGWLETLGEVYTEENFDGLRAMLLRSTLDAASQFMGGAFLEEYLRENGTDLVTSVNYYMQYQEHHTNSLLNNVYTKAAEDPEAAAVVGDLFLRLKDAFAQRIAASDWLSDSTKERALQKLDAMEIYIGGPDVIDYSGLALPSDNGGGPLANDIALKRAYRANQASIAGEAYSNATWNIMSYEVNMMNVYDINSVFVPWAYIQDGYAYDSEASVERLIGSLGITLGHEITHGFDDAGRGWWIDGTPSDWWAPGDDEAFDAKVAALKDYISGIVLVPEYRMDADGVANEIMCDMGGMAVALDLASGIEGFDYREMFESYTLFFRAVYPPEFLGVLSSSSYPPECARVNMAVQQFQEFMDAYGVREGDGMWLAPGDRVAIW